MSTKQGKNAVVLTKQSIRSKILLLLKNQKEEDRDRKSKLIKRKLLRTKVFKKAKNVMFYVAFGGEVETNEMIKEAKKLGKIVTVPIGTNNRASLRPCILDEHAKLRKGPYGVYEPVSKCFLREINLDLVIVPGLAFDKKGRRLGRGKGCYDRFLNSLSGKTASIGLAFDFQILPKVPTATHDVNVSRVLYA